MTLPGLFEGGGEIGSGRAGENASNQYQLNTFRAAQIFVSLPGNSGQQLTSQLHPTGL